MITKRDKDRGLREANRVLERRSGHTDFGLMILLVVLFSLAAIVYFAY